MELKKYEHSVTAQWGEDGVIAEIIKRIGTTTKIAVEFGSWDGKHLSNIYDLWHNQGWGAVLIESDTERHEACQQEYGANKKLHFVNAFVEPSGKNALDAILERELGSTVPDLISIDIDSDDYHILDSLKKKLPRVLVVEYNPTIPPHIELIQAKGGYMGSSALAILNLAKKKGYSLAHITKTNLILVADAEFRKLKIKEVELTLENFPAELLNYVVTAYDGSPLLLGEPPYMFMQPLPDAIKGDKYQSRHNKLANKPAVPVKAIKIYGRE